VKYSLKVRAICLLSGRTLGTCIVAGTHCTDPLYTEESDVDEQGYGISDPVTNPVSQDVEKPVEGAISTVREEISELDTMGFDENLLLDEYVDM
jgi:hypothetical protein